MQIIYDKLFAILKEKGITQKQIKESLKMNGNTFSKLRRNENVTIETIGKLCGYLHCTPNDVMEVIYDKTNASEREMREKQYQEIVKLEKQLKKLKTK